LTVSEKTPNIIHNKSYGLTDDGWKITKKQKQIERKNKMNTANTNGAVTTAAVTNMKEKIQGRKPRIVDYVTKFATKHGPGSTHGMRFHGEKGIQDIEAAIAVLNTLKSQVVIAPVAPVAPQAAPVAAPAAPVAEAQPAQPEQPAETQPVTAPVAPVETAPAVS